MVHGRDGPDERRFRIALYGVLISARAQGRQDAAEEWSLPDPWRPRRLQVRLERRVVERLDELGRGRPRTRPELARRLVLRGLGEALAECDPGFRRAVLDRAIARLRTASASEGPEAPAPVRPESAPPIGAGWSARSRGRRPARQQVSG